MTRKLSPDELIRALNEIILEVEHREVLVRRIPLERPPLKAKPWPPAKEDR